MIARLLRCLCVDVRASKRSVLIWLAVACLVLLVAMASHWLEMGSAYLIQGDDAVPRYNLGDCLMTLVQGVPPFAGGDLTRFQLPIVWFVTYVLMLYGTLRYPAESLYGFGQKVLVASGSPWAWWLSKCLWVVLCVLAYVAVALLVCVACALIQGGTLSLEAGVSTPGIERYLGHLSPFASFNMASMLVPCVAVAVAISLLQLFLSVAIGPLVSFTACISVLLASAYFNAPLGFGCLSMAIRHLPQSYFTCDAAASLAVCAVVSCACVLLGGMVFARSDYLVKGEALEH